MKAHLLGTIALAAASLLGACSVDELSNPQRKDRAACLAAGGTPIDDTFCRLPTDAGGALDAAESGSRDASDDDAGVSVDAGMGADAGDAGPTPPESCAPDAREWCYTGADPSTALQPPCHAGNRVCRDGKWSACELEVLPRVESCNAQDDDCDGHIDEQDTTVVVCAVTGATGACRDGAQVCTAGNVQCVPLRQPTAETCNGTDDDCNGQTDEGLSQVCYEQGAAGCTRAEDGTYTCQGNCVTGTQNCQNGAFDGTCQGAVTPSAESCTSAGGVALDDDCDGMIDEGCTCISGASCYTGSPPGSQNRAPCHAGTQSCSDATHGVCMGEVKPSVEACDNPGVDDDCDGVVDDLPLIGRSCADESRGLGACKAGATWQCQAGARRCVDAAKGSEACDGKRADEDCDGKTDEGFDLSTDAANCGACGAPCGTGLVCCDGSCTDTKTSQRQCGACGNACASSDTCCGGVCVNTILDSNNCGECSKNCLLNLNCVSGSCKLL